MKEIKLTRDKVALVDDEDYERVNQFKWSVSKIKNNWYALSRLKIVNGQPVMMHRFILNLDKDDPEVDHENMDSLDNRRDNLRLAPVGSNQRNKRKYKNKDGSATSSEFKGVSRYTKNKWIAYININKKRIYLGVFIDEIEAAKAYDDAAKEYHGEFARTNF